MKNERLAVFLMGVVEFASRHPYLTIAIFGTIDYIVLSSIFN